MSYFVAPLHPDLVEARAPGYRGGFFTRAEKERQIDAFYAERQEIPLCIDHCGAATCGFVVPERERIGRVVDLFNDARGRLMVKLKLDNRHAAYARIHRGMQLRGERWGVSVWIDRDARGNKRLTHVALTTDPAFAALDTFLQSEAVEEWALDREIVRRHYRGRGHGQCYAAPAFEKRLAGI